MRNMPIYLDDMQKHTQKNNLNCFHGWIPFHFHYERKRTKISQLLCVRARIVLKAFIIQFPSFVWMVKREKERRADWIQTKFISPHLQKFTNIRVSAHPVRIHANKRILFLSREQPNYSSFFHHTILSTIIIIRERNKQHRRTAELSDGRMNEWKLRI